MGAPTEPETPAETEARKTRQYIEALLVERAGVDRRGLTGRVKEVDAELKRVGYTKPPATTKAPKETRSE